ncbi:hypothetical protein [Lactobacillus porci]
MPALVPLKLLYGLAHTSYEDLGGLADRQLYKDKCNGRDGF